MVRGHDCGRTQSGGSLCRIPSWPSLTNLMGTTALPRLSGMCVPQGVPSCFSFFSIYFPLACILVVLIHVLSFSLGSITSSIFYTYGSAHRAFRVVVLVLPSGVYGNEVWICAVLSSGLTRTVILIPSCLKEMLQRTYCWELASTVRAVSVQCNAFDRAT
jgi:hypothetical protein